MDSVELFRPLRARPRRLALLPAAFHPPTRAHEALLAAALGQCDAVLAVLARSLPHKEYSGATLEQRLETVFPLTGARTGAAVSQGGLFLEMAREAQALFPGVEIHLVCGRDAAERAAAWRYEGLPSMAEQLREYRLLVAAREGGYEAPAAVAHSIERLEWGDGWDAVSSTEMRRRMASGEPWEHLVPAACLDAVRRVYSPLPFSRNARSL